MKRLIVVLGGLVLAGCGGGVVGGKTTNEAVKWTNRGIAFAQCMQDSIKTPSPEATSQQCVLQWFPEVGTAGAEATQIAKNLATCVRLRVVAAEQVPAGTQRQSYLIGEIGTCTSQYGPQLVEAIQKAGK